MNKLGWGIIGAGGIADRRTMPAMLLSERSQIAAVMEVDGGVSEALRAKYGAARAYTSAEALMRDPAVDAVYIASPVVLHAEQAMLAADCGKHILIEKPLAMTADEGQRVVDHCARRGVKIAAGLMMRFGGHNMAMKKAISEGSIGDLATAYAQFTCWYPDMPGNWRQSKERAGGGALMDMGVHCIDLIQHIAGSRVRQVAAMHGTQTFRYDVEDASTVLLRLENGAQCVVQSNFNIPDEAAKWRLEFFGTRGHLMGDGTIGQVDGGSVDAVFLDKVGGYDARQDGREVRRAEISAEMGNMYLREIDSFASSILDGTPLEVPAEDAVQVQRVIEAAYRSNDENRIITL